MSEILGFSLFPEINFRRLKVLAKLYHGNFVSAWQHLSYADLQKLNLKPEQANEILAAKKTLDLEKYRQALINRKIQILDVFDNRYPQSLRQIYDPPILLYVQGNPDYLNSDSIAIVGTRQPTPYGLKAVEKCVHELSLTGYTIVSGLATGIDTAAHHQALENKLPTIAVMATGLDFVYPRENKKLAQKICEHGALISESPLFCKPEKWRFPKRNRIITGLSRAVFVMEGSLKSGALISGKIALEQNRDVYALPGSIFSEKSEGPNWLIAQGAKPLLSAGLAVEEIFAGQQLVFPEPQLKQFFLNADEDIVFQLIEKHECLLFDQLFEQTNFDFQKLNKIILDLELKGIIAQLPGKKLVKM